MSVNFLDYFTKLNKSSVDVSSNPLALIHSLFTSHEKHKCMQYLANYYDENETNRRYLRASSNQRPTNLAQTTLFFSFQNGIDLA